MIEFRVRDHCWHACSVVGEGKYKKADSKTLYLHRVNDVRAEHVGLPLDQYGWLSIPIIYILNSFYQMTVQVSRCPSTPNSPPTRYEILSQKLFLPGNTSISNPRTIHHSNPDRSLNKSSNQPNVFNIQASDY